jgi:hypothetical protein
VKRFPGGRWILAASLAGCSRPGTPRDAAPVTASQAEFRGKVVVTGSEPVTSVMLIGNEGNVELVGGLEPEMRRLAGAGLLVRGSLQGSRPAQTLEVRDYEIMDIDGEVPSTGVLRNQNGRLWLTGKDTLELSGAPEALGDKDGAKVWIVGRRSGNSLTVQSYGIIKER